MDHITRRKRSRGRWMKLTNPDLMAEYMTDRDFSQARLARYAGVSRQFIWKLVNDPTTGSCTEQVAARIEEALNLLPGTLFLPNESPITRRIVTTKRTRRAA